MNKLLGPDERAFFFPSLPPVPPLPLLLSLPAVDSAPASSLAGGNGGAGALRAGESCGARQLLLDTRLWFRDIKISLEHDKDL